MGIVHYTSQTCCQDNDLLEQYYGQLADQGIDSARRRSMLTIARQFLQWWRKRFVGEEYVVSTRNGAGPVRGVDWSGMQEVYLRSAGSDHQWRCTQRNELARFLTYVAGAE